MSTPSSRTYTNIGLILVVFSLGETWRLSSNAPVNYWLEKEFDFPIEGWWYWKLLSENIAWVLAAFVMVRLAKMRKWLELVCVMHFVYRLFNLGSYVYNFNRNENAYMLAYASSGLIAAFVYWYRHLRKPMRIKLIKKSEVEIIGKPQKPPHDTIQDNRGSGMLSV